MEFFIVAILVNLLIAILVLTGVRLSSPGPTQHTKTSATFRTTCSTYAAQSVPKRETEHSRLITMRLNDQDYFDKLAMDAGTCSWMVGLNG